MSNNKGDPHKQQPTAECSYGNYQQSEGFRMSSGGFNNPSEPTNSTVMKNHNNSDIDIEAYNSDNDIKGFAFKDETIRKDFIRKVYFILMNQLLITFGIVLLITYHIPTQIWINHNLYIMWIALFVMIITIIVLSCSQNIRRLSPINIILLSLFTMSEGFLVGLISTNYDQDAIVMSIGMTSIICLSLTLFAFQTKWDFTIYGGSLLICLVVFFLFGLIAIFLPASKLLSLVYASIGVILFSIYLIYDTQLMIGGDHKYSISPEEYIFAVLNLYMDIINIFIYILSLIGSAREA